MTSIEQLYKDYEVLSDAKEKAGEHEDVYKSIINGTEGGPSEKQLACQFMSQFFKYFPHLADEVIPKMLDLCEDENAIIRKHAFKELPSYCKVCPEYLPKIADIMVQLLQSDDKGELAIVHMSLVSLLTTDPKGTLTGFFAQIVSGEDIVRERAIKFLADKLNSVPEDKMKKDVEDYIISESKTVLADVTGEEFVLFMKILSNLKSMQTVLGRQQLVEIITKQAELDVEFVASDPDCMDKLIQCCRQLTPFLSKNVHSDSFVSYIAEQVLPVLSEVPGNEVEDGENEGQSIHLDLLKLFAEMSTYCGDIPDIEDKVSKVFDKLLQYMPLPPLEESKEDQLEDPKLQFSHVECLLYAFHQLARKTPDFLTSDADRLKDFRLRLQYFGRGVQVYIKQLRMALQGKTGEALKTDENKIKVVALKITTNINALIKDLMHNPPSYKTPVNLSWKPVAKAATAVTTSPGAKRAAVTPISYDRDSKQPNRGQDRKLYRPPTGKWSDSAGSYQAPRGGRGRGGFRGRRGFRGNRW